MIFKPFGVADFLDITCVAVFLYALLVWFKKSSTAFVTIGLLIFVSVYGMARLMGMVMTVWIFKGFFTVFIIAVIIIFQEEIRKIFERIAIWSLTGNRSAALPKETEVLLKTLSKFSQEKFGALIVLSGRDPLDRHLEGGWDLHGQLSQALLESIFDWHSLGHDGAVIIERGLVTRFGCHLPLSNNFSQVPDSGTRHSAALGLSERTDALCLVVSEEKGTISVAQAGRIENMPDMTSLQKRMEFFFEDLEPSATGRPRHFLTHNGREKTIALAIAILMWIFFVGLGLR